MRETVRADCTESKGLLLRGLTSALDRAPASEEGVVRVLPLCSAATTDVADADDDDVDVDVDEDEEEEAVLRSRERVAMMSPRRL